MGHYLTVKKIVETAYTLQLKGNLERAKKYYLEALKIHPKEFDALHMLGVIELELGNISIAKDLLNRALDIYPNHPGAINNAGLIALDAKDLDSAIQYFQRALDIDPNFTQAKCNFALTLYRLRKFEKAKKFLEAQIKLYPMPAEAHNTLGLALFALNLPEKAIEAFTLSLQIKTEYPEAYYNLGNAYSALKQTTEALACYEKALQLNDRMANAWFNRGNTLRELLQYKSAINSYERAQILSQNIPGLLGVKLHTQMYMCDWSDFDREKLKLTRGIRDGNLTCPPLALMSIVDDPDLHKMATDTWVKTYLTPPEVAPIGRRLPESEKVKIGYFSSDFHNHATMYLISGLLRNHDRESFEIFFFSFDVSCPDEMRALVSLPTSHYFDVNNVSDFGVAELARQIGIDVAIDLKGFTADCRPNIFAFRAAPIQISYLGYPGTMCCPFIDFIIADATVINPDYRDSYTEKILFMPNCYQPSDNRRQLITTQLSKQDHGIAENNFVFCSFNSPHKITPECFSKWMQVLHATVDQNSVLWLLADSEITRVNLRKEAKKRKIDAHRLVFAASLEQPEHLARLKFADLALDTLPYNSHTSGSDALWAGVPLVTEIGRSFASRVGASLLKAVRLDDLICSSSAEFVTMAKRLAYDNAFLAQKRSILKEGQASLPLFATEQYTRDFENILIGLCECEGRH